MKLKLENIHSKDVEDILLRMEKSFRIKFEHDELKDVKTFGELSDHILSKLEGVNTGGCTSQQSFYKLRQAWSSKLNIEPRQITPKTSIKKLLPTKGKRKFIRSLEKDLGFPTHLLVPSAYIACMTFILFVVVPFFSDVPWEVILFGLFSSFLGSIVVGKFVLEINDNIAFVSQVVDKLVRLEYMSCRRIPGTYNRDEVEQIIHQWFCDDLSLNSTELTRKSKF